jgi:CubicO group peptidase (beta-lactamase class C family)
MIRHNAMLSILAASLLAFPRSATGSPAADRLGRAIDAYVTPLVARDQLSGQLLVARHDTILVERNFGFADWELRSPVTPETRFCIASVTKPMTGTVAIQLLAARTIALTDTIGRWLPGFPKGDRITISDLLRHRSGIPHELIPDSEATRPMTAADMVAIARRQPLDFEPGSRSQYSSGGYSVLARILELVTGKTYAQLLSERLWGPLGMNHTSDQDSRALLPGRARAVVPGAHGLMNAPYEDFSHIVGAGSVWSTARDLHRFVQAVVSGALGPGPQASYLRDGKLDFNGLAGGFVAWCAVDSASGIEVIFAGNEHTGAPELLKSAVPQLAAGKSVSPPKLPEAPSRSPDPAELAGYVGTFRLDNGTRLVVSVRDGVLWANDWVLLPSADGSFFSPRDYGIVRGVKGPDGRIARLDWEQRGQVYPAPRVAG